VVASLPSMGPGLARHEGTLRPALGRLRLENPEIENSVLGKKKCLPKVPLICVYTYMCAYLRCPKQLHMHFTQVRPNCLYLFILYPEDHIMEFFFFFFFAILGFELRAYTLSHSTSPFFVMGFFRDRVSSTIRLGWL
jgi:hypothetical protein